MPAGPSPQDSPPVSAPRRVFVTGIGVLCPLGNTVAELAEGIASGRMGLRSLTLGDGDRALDVLAGVVDAPLARIDGKQRRRWDRVGQLAVQAAFDAIDDAGATGGLPKKSGVFFGSGFGGLGTLLRELDVLRQRGPGRVSPYLVPGLIANAPTGLIAEALGIRGPALTFTTACASGANAIGEAWRRIRAGELQAALAGGAEAPLHAIAAAGFDNMRALAPDGAACQPFQVGRTGFCLAEGAAILLLEEAEAALNRRATIYAELAGYDTAADAHHPTDPDPEGRGAERALRGALRAATLDSRDVDYVNAHATGTPVGDRAEAAMLERVFYHAPGPWVSSSKGQLGHSLGAAGAVEAAVTVLTIQSGILPANVPMSGEVDTALRLVVTPGTQAPVRHAVSNSFGFGGVNAALAFSRPDLGVDRW